MSITAPHQPVPAAPSTVGGALNSTAQRLIAYLLAVLVVAATVAMILVRSGGDVAPTIDGDSGREWTREQTLDHLARINGYLPGQTTTTARAPGVPAVVR